MATNIRNQIWHDAMWDLAKAIARYTLKAPESFKIVQTIVNSQDLSIEVDLLNRSVAIYNSYIDGSIDSTFGALAYQHLTFPTVNLWSTDLSAYLASNNFKISGLLLDVISNNDIELSDSLIYEEGYWEHKSLIINRSGLYSLYHFEIEVSEDSNFSSISVSVDSSKSTKNWFYEKEPNEFVDIPSDGVPSSYIDRKILYKSTSSKFLDRGKEYYFRIRQKDQYDTYNYVSSSDVIGT